MRINIQPYDPAWPNIFSKIQFSLEFLLRAHSVPFIAIEHVGSTSVPGLAAKPIIDIDIIVTASALHSAINALTDANISSTSSTASVAATSAEKYTYIGERGIPGRHALREPGFEGDDGGGGLKHTRNVYLCVEGCLALRNHLAVRDILRQDESLIKEYEKVMWAAAERECYSVEGYVEAKTEVLIKVLERSGEFGVEERKEIVGVNVRGGVRDCSQ